MTMERDSLVARLEKRAKFNEATIKIDKVAFYERSDIALDRESAAALSRPVQAVKALEWETLETAVEHCARIAEASDSGRGNEKQIAAGIRSYAAALKAFCLTTAAPLQADTSAPVSPAIQAVTDEMVSAAYEELRRRLIIHPSRDQVKAALEAALHPAPEAASQAAAGETLAQAEARVMQEYRWGNLTPLGVANHLRRAGFRSQVAVEKANALAPSDTAPSPKGVSDGVRAAFSGTDDRDTELEAAAREAGWALMELVDSIDWTKRDQVSEIITRLGAALSSKSVPATAEEWAASKEGA